MMGVLGLKGERKCNDMATEWRVRGGGGGAGAKTHAHHHNGCLRDCMAFHVLPPKHRHENI